MSNNAPKTPCDSGTTNTLAANFVDAEAVRKGAVRVSKMSRRRAWVLILIHVAVFVHILQWKLQGRTLTPLEPSEAMYTLVQGAVNAGAIVMGGSLLLTLVLGRFFCGWACHMVAIQDVCAWLLKKVGLRPRPLRSRLMMFVPLLAGLYMFFWPVLWLSIAGQWPPEFHSGFMETEFWDTFPGFWMGLVTYLVCGLGMVWVLGAKGFCTYACPYGGLFGVMDRLAPGRIVVTDACKGCGHCTAVCTSNVLVHQEVRDFGKVMDPGCMKCLDCVSVCPENALHFGFTMPAAFTRARRQNPVARLWSFSLREDALLALLFGFAMLVFRGLPDNFVPEAGNLYSEVPLLLGVGLSATMAFVLLLLWKLLRRPELVLFGQELKRKGRRTRAGTVWLAVFLLCTAFFAHSAVLQVAMLRGNLAVSATSELAPLLWSGNREGLKAETDWSADEIAAGRAAILFAQRIELFAQDQCVQQLAWFDALEGQYDEALRRMRILLARYPDRHRLRFDAARLLALKGDVLDAEREYMAAVRGAPDDLFMRSALPHLANDLYAGGFVRNAVNVLQLACELAPTDAGLHSALAQATVTDGRPQEALALLDRFAAAGHPVDVHLRVQHAQILESCGRREEGLRELEQLHKDAPTDARAAFWSAVMHGRSARETEADAWWAEGRKRDPKLPEWRPVAFQ